jgi:hypothetical protein
MKAIRRWPNTASFFLIIVPMCGLFALWVRLCAERDWSPAVAFAPVVLLFIAVNVWRDCAERKVG